MWASETPFLGPLRIPLRPHLVPHSFEHCIGFSIPPVGDRRPDTPHLADTPQPPSVALNATPHLNLNDINSPPFMEVMHPLSSSKRQKWPILSSTAEALSLDGFAARVHDPSARVYYRTHGMKDDVQANLSC
jgi:hypothetical protein